MRIAKPLLAITTPLGVAIGLREAWRFHWWLALLMGVLLSVIGAFFLMTLKRIRAESSAPPRPPEPPGQADRPPATTGRHSR